MNSNKNPTRENIENVKDMVSLNTSIGFAILWVLDDAADNVNAYTTAKQAADEYVLLQKKSERLEQIEAMIIDLNEWLKRSSLSGTAHQRILEAIVKGK